MFITDPTRLFVNSKNGSAEVCKVESVFAIQAVAANVLFVPAVAGKIIRVMGLTVSSTVGGTNGAINLLDGSGGTIKWAFTAPDPLVNNPIKEELRDCGLFECTVGVALVITVQTASVNIFVNYIQYTA